MSWSVAGWRRHAFRRWRGYLRAQQLLPVAVLHINGRQRPLCGRRQSASVWVSALLAAECGMDFSLTFPVFAAGEESYTASCHHSSEELSRSGERDNPNPSGSCSADVGAGFGEQFESGRGVMVSESLLRSPLGVAWISV